MAGGMGWCATFLLYIPFSIAEVMSTFRVELKQSLLFAECCHGTPVGYLSPS